MSMKRFLSLAIVSMGLSSVIPAQAASSIDDLINAEKELFTDLKYYLGVVSAENAGAQNLLQYMWPLIWMSLKQWVAICYLQSKSVPLSKSNA